MRSKLVPIGNSRGLRLPKAILQQCRLQDDVDLEIRDGCLIIRPCTAPRTGWDAAFSKMVARGDDQLLDAPESHIQTHWERRNWKW